MKTDLHPLLDNDFQQVVDLLNLGFSDYFVHIELTLPLFFNMVRIDGIDLGSSRTIYWDEEPVGVALIARRGWTSRLATMCIVPGSRRRGAGRTAMDLLLTEASVRGDRAMVLEVIENNVPAVRLYEGCGFRSERRLFSFEGTLPEGAGSARLQEIDIRDVARLVTLHGLDNLPWQVSGESLAQSGPPGKAYRLDDASIVISNPHAEQIAIRSIVVLPEARGQGQATRLVQAVATHHPGKKWLVPAICPAEIGGFLERAGLAPGTLTQMQMRLDIS